MFPPGRQCPLGAGVRGEGHETGFSRFERGSLFGSRVHGVWARVRSTGFPGGGPPGAANDARFNHALLDDALLVVGCARRRLTSGFGHGRSGTGGRIQWARGSGYGRDFPSGGRGEFLLPGEIRSTRCRPRRLPAICPGVLSETRTGFSTRQRGFNGDGIQASRGVHAAPRRFTWGGLGAR